ncbi:Antigen P35 (plasmid) [Borrelia coriaceae ATCC 43381]|uniref:Antigen P35 n=1 Tax=Borrelia coriaceae ATCC 43381 TaxID=1408429 RepID=W5SW59_9SPIR|nr:Antigen P35 [Borrelia coriaceae ATCC 43381]
MLKFTSKENILKKYLFILSFIIIVTLTSCKSDLNEKRPQTFNDANQQDWENWTLSINQDDIPSQKKYKAEIERKVKRMFINALKKEIQNIMASIERDQENIQKNEPADQFGMKNGAFKIIIGNPSQKAYNDPESQNNRRQFYSSLNYNKEKIRKLGTILNQITLDHANRRQLHIDITNAGRVYSQAIFELVINKIREVQDKLDSLQFKELRMIKIQLNAIVKLRSLWQNTADNIIKDYDNNIEIKTDSQKLIKHIREKYGNILQKEIPKISLLASEINKILKK